MRTMGGTTVYDVHRGENSFLLSCLFQKGPMTEVQRLAVDAANESRKGRQEGAKG